MRRRMVERLAGRWGVTLTPPQLALLSGGSRGWNAGRVIRKVLIYPVKELFRKVLYFLAIKDAVDTFSLLFHQGYLVHAALSRGALGRSGARRGAAAAVAGRARDAGGDRHPAAAPVADRRAAQTAGSGARHVRWLTSRLRSRRDAVPAVTAIADEGESRPTLGSPDAEQLLDRLLLALWGERGYLERLDADLAQRLQPAQGGGVPGGAL